MTLIGYSTGSLALGNFRSGIQMLRGKPYAAIELSALRETELESLVESLDDLSLEQFSYVSVHAPSFLIEFSERQLARCLEPVFDRRWPTVIHPDLIDDYAIWRDYGELVCVENMDKRKPTGRTAAELAEIFEQIPQASLCFDIGHARQVDPTMIEASNILRGFGTRLKQLHVSEVNTASGHESLNAAAVSAFSKVAPLIPVDIPIIMETPVGPEWIESEADWALRALMRSHS